MRKFFLQIFHISSDAFKRLNEERGAEAAAGMAFYGFFSLFPLLLVLVAMGSSILQIPRAEKEVLTFLVSVFPFSGDLVAGNIEQVLEIRGSVGSLAFAALAWSGSGVFSVLVRNINRAWPNTDQHDFLKRRFFAFIMLFVLIIILLFLLFLKNILPIVLSLANGWGHKLNKLQELSYIMIWVTLFTTLLVLYRWIPNRQVPLTSGVWGGIITTLGLILATQGFSWYLKSGLARYNLVYGSLGAIAILLFWIYISSYIILFGTHLSAAVAHFHEKER